MVVKKFYGKTTRDALRQVREELGADALILSNRPTVGGGVEIMAVADADVATLTTSLSTTTSRHPPRNAPVPAPRSGLPQLNGPTEGSGQNSSAPTGAVNRALARTYAMPVEPLSSPAVAPPPQARQPEPPREPPRRAAQIPTMDEAQEAPSAFRPQAQRAAHTPPPTYSSASAPHSESLRQLLPEPDVDLAQQRDIAVEELKTIGDEIKQLRSLLQSQLASFAWGDLEHKAPNRLELFRHLLSAGFSAALIRQLIDKMPGQYAGEVALKWARSALMHNLKCADADRELLDHGGVFALVGPTGVGKTTTVAKLAARATMRFGPQHVALITTDSYRIGAQDQLRIYGKILGRPVERLLLITANADGHTLEDVVRQYRGEGMSGCLLSKIDEAISLGPALDAIIRNRMRLFYVTNGQRVPEDLHLSSASFLVDRALKAPQHPGSPFTLQGDELAIMNAAQAGWL
jgi:flagellar biosynthesis protein FlhF